MKTFSEEQKSPILFFDTYIISANDKGGLHKLNHMQKALSIYRDSFPTYRWEKKIDIVKYTLCSYAKINWEKVIIRFECEDENETESFFRFCRSLFPDALIENRRSATAKEYFDSLVLLDIEKNPWIYLSSNNDHPYVGDTEFMSYCLDIANDLETKYIDKDVCILYSHFTESMIDNKISDPQWGYFDSSFKKIIFEDKKVIATISNKLTLDSIKIYRLNYLLNLFSKTQNKGRLIRTEDTGFHLTYSKKLITVSPKVELCRHFDSYAHLMKWIPPLFIPAGFFEFNIKIRYGYEHNIEGWVSVNPNLDNISSEVDLCCFIEDLPSFWSDRISIVDVNPSFELKVSRLDSTYYKNLHNPFHRQSKISNILRSAFVWVCQILPWRNSAIILNFLSILKYTGAYKQLQKVKNLKKPSK